MLQKRRMRGNKDSRRDYHFLNFLFAAANVFSSIIASWVFFIKNCFSAGTAICDWTAIAYKEKTFSDKPEFSEEMFSDLNSSFLSAEKNKKITLTYYRDGEFINYTGTVLKKDIVNRTVTIDENVFLLDDILNIILL